jgi:Uma2 family endonuclease
VQGATTPDFPELEGTPEMVLEVVSATSVQKDTVELRELYWKAGIAEYWLVDVRKGNVEFNILKHGSKAYATSRHQPGGWLKSTVFNHSFRLTQGTDPLGKPLFQLEAR